MLAAEDACGRRGGHLASAHSVADNQKLGALMEQNGITQPMWIGLNDAASEAGSDGSKFVWTDGTANNIQARRPDTAAPPL